MEWDKGHALAHLLDALGLEGRDDVLPIYIGDDRCGSFALCSFRAPTLTRGSADVRRQLLPRRVSAVRRQL